MFRSQERIQKPVLKEHYQTGPVEPSNEEFSASRNQHNSIYPKPFSSISKSRANHMRHSSINTHLSNSPGSFTKSPKNSQTSHTYRQQFANPNYEKPSHLPPKTGHHRYSSGSGKNKVKKYYERATRLSPRSWIKKKNSTSKQLIMR